MNRENICNVLVFIIYVLLVFGIQYALYLFGNPSVVWFWDLFLGASK